MLADLGFRGPKYTCSNCQEGRAFIKEGLDRGVANLEWRNWFPKAMVSMEATMSSDHAPLVLSLSKIQRRNKGNKRFRYEAGWALEDGCKGVIASAWEKDSLQQPMGWDQLDKKLYNCKKQISL